MGSPSSGLRTATRDTSGRRIDYVFGTDAVTERIAGALIYDARDEEEITMTLAGAAPDREATEVASDHFPVVVDVSVP